MSHVRCRIIKSIGALTLCYAYEVAPIIAVANQKGGVAKTTTVLNLAAGLAARSHRVLIVDLDPQANATSSTPADLNRAGEASMFHVLGEGHPLPSIIQRAWAGVDIAPSSIQVARLEPTLSGALDVYRLKEALEDVDYEFAVVDCPPSLGPLTLNALVAATHVLVPVKAATYGLAAISDFEQTRTLVSKRLNPSLELLGILITQWDGRTVLAREAAEYLERQYGDQLLNTRIRVNVRLDEAVSAQEPIFKFDSASSGAQDYTALTEEVLQRVGR